MSENWLVQQNVKVGADLINLRADSPEQFGLIADWVIENAAKFVSVAAALNAVPPALAPNVASTQVVNEPAHQQAPQQPPQSQWGQPQQSSPPPWAGQQQQGAGPTCQHGPREYKEGTSKAGKPYKMWACPSQNRQSQCEPVWVR